MPSSDESELKNAAIHFGKAIISMANLTKIILVGHDSKTGFKLVKQTFDKSFDPKQNKPEAKKEQQKYETEMKSYLSKSVKSGYSELKNIATQSISFCTSLLKILTKGLSAGVSSIHSTTQYFKSKLHDQKIEVENDHKPEGPRPK